MYEANTKLLGIQRMVTIKDERRAGHPGPPGINGPGHALSEKFGCILLNLGDLVGGSRKQFGSDREQGDINRDLFCKSRTFIITYQAFYSGVQSLNSKSNHPKAGNFAYKLIATNSYC